MLFNESQLRAKIKHNLVVVYLGDLELALDCDIDCDGYLLGDVYYQKRDCGNWFEIKNIKGKNLDRINEQLEGKFDEWDYREDQLLQQGDLAYDTQRENEL